MTSRQLVGLVTAIKTPKDLEAKGNKVYGELLDHCAKVEALLNDAPSARDLDACNEFLNKLGNLYVRHTLLHGIAEGLYAAASNVYLRSLDGEELKKYKGSSTLMERYVNGKNPAMATIWQQMKSMEWVFKTVSDNYRTLIASYRNELETVESMHARNTKSNG